MQLGCGKVQSQEFSEEIVYCKGWIPQSFEQHPEYVYRFVHVDVDLYQPTLESLNYFYPRLSAGGVILCDDYGFNSCPGGATQACVEFFANKSERIVALADGGAFVIKQETTVSQV